MTALVDAMLRLGPDDLKIEVISTLPNRYATYSEEAQALEESDKLIVHRVELPPHKSDLAGQSIAFLKFAREARRLALAGDHDLIFATSSRLMTAFLGAYIARRKERPLYLDIRDIFVDTIGDLFSGVKARVATAVFRRIESWTIRSASRVNVVSMGFREYFEARYPGIELSFHTNGIDDEFIESSPRDRQPTIPSKPVKILYAGNMGEGQCLHDIVPGLAKQLAGKAQIVVIGDGGRRRQLEEALMSEGIDNVELRPPVQRADLIREYHASDVLFLHLGDYDAFKKVLPSKIFEYAALGKPILAGVAGFAAEFLEQEVSNAAVFPPSDVDAAVQAFATLKMVHTNRSRFVEKFSRRTISEELAKDVVSLIEDRQ